MFSPICHLEDLLENRDRPSTYFTRGPMAIFDSIFGSEDRRRKVVRYSGSNSEEGGFRSSGSKIEDRNGGFFRSSGFEDRRPPHLESSIFGAEDRRPPIFNLRSSAPKIEDLSIFDLRPILWTEDAGSDFFEDRRGSLKIGFGAEDRILAKVLTFFEDLRVYISASLR